MTSTSTDPTSLTIVQQIRSAPLASHLPAKEASILYHFRVLDCSKPRLRPDPSTYTTGRSWYSTPSSLASSQACHPSDTVVSNHASRSWGPGYRPSRSHRPYDFQNAEYYPRTHELPSATVNSTWSDESRPYTLNRSQWDVVSNASYAEPRGPQWDANGDVPFSPSNPPAVHKTANLVYHSQDPPLAQEGHAVFGRCTSIAVNNYGHITTQVDARPPQGTQSSCLPRARVVPLTACSPSPLKSSRQRWSMASYSKSAAKKIVHSSTSDYLSKTRQNRAGAFPIWAFTYRSSASFLSICHLSASQTSAYCTSYRSRQEYSNHSGNLCDGGMPCSLVTGDGLPHQQDAEIWDLFPAGLLTGTLPCLSQITSAGECVSAQR